MHGLQQGLGRLRANHLQSVIENEARHAAPGDVGAGTDERQAVATQAAGQSLWGKAALLGDAQQRSAVAQVFTLLEIRSQ